MNLSFKNGKLFLFVHHHHSGEMRPLVLFMILVGIFVIGKGACTLSDHNWLFGFFGKQGKGEVVTAHRTVADYRQIENSISASIEWQAGETWDIEISAQPNMEELLKTEVKNNTLEIYFKESVSSYEPITIRITSPYLEGVSIAGSGDFKANSMMKAEKMKFEIGGSGTINVPELTAGTVDCDIAGSGDIDLGGTTEDLNINVAGSGKASVKKLNATRVDAEIAGSGDVFCTAKDQLKISIAGSGSVHYSGNPSVESHTAGSGDVIKD